MRAVNAVLIGFLVVLFGFGAGAQTLRTAKGPAEIPPPGYKASQYVDSRGCAFIRAGYGGSVRWVPRVQRNRRVVCGMRPTAVAGARPARQITRIAASRPAAVGPLRRIKPRVISAQIATTAGPRTPRQPGRRRTAVANWNTFMFGTPVRVVARPVAAHPAVVSSPVRAVAAPRPPRRVAVSQRHGGKWIDPAPIIARSRAIALGQRGASYHPSSTSTPLRIEVTRAAPIALPPGYKSILASEQNPAFRGRGTPAGQAAMDLIWTQTMPRRLIEVTTGQDVTTRYAQIRYPYTSVRVSTSSYVMANGPRVYRDRPRATAQTGQKSTLRRKRKVIDEAAPTNMKGFRKINDVSASDSSIGRKGPSAPPDQRFIQVATFGVPDNAVRTLSRFRAKGLPTASRALRRAGRSYKIVLLGPFSDRAGLNAGLKSARRAGFSDAFLVR